MDANVLITANDEYYPIDRIPQFWNWLIDNAKQNRIKIPYEILAEIKAGQVNRNQSVDHDELVRWLARDNHERELRLRASASRRDVNRVFSEGYELPAPTIDDLKKIGKDPLLIAYAKARPGAVVVTLEAKQENATDLMKKRKRKIPFVCRKLGIRCIDTFVLIRELDFRIV